MTDPYSEPEPLPNPLSFMYVKDDHTIKVIEESELRSVLLFIRRIFFFGVNPLTFLLSPTGVTRKTAGLCLFFFGRSDILFIFTIKESQSIRLSAY